MTFSLFSKEKKPGPISPDSSVTAHRACTYSHPIRKTVKGHTKIVWYV
jgi:hypothetical protein